MSLDAQDWVWEHSRSKGTARLVILAIADKASGPDCSAYAGTTFLMRRANAGRTAVVEAVDKLLALGEVEIVKGRRGPRGETCYRLPKAAGHHRGGPDSGPVRKADRYGKRTGTESGPLGVRNPDRGGTESGPVGVRNPDPITQLNAVTPEGTQRERGAPPRETTPPTPAEAPLASLAPPPAPASLVIDRDSLAVHIADELSVRTGLDVTPAHAAWVADDMLTRMPPRHDPVLWVRGQIRVSDDLRRFLTPDLAAAYTARARRPTVVDNTDRPRKPVPLPDDFAVTDAMRRWAARDAPAADVDHETAQFISHHRARGTKCVSWPDEWQKWVRGARPRPQTAAVAAGHQPYRNPVDQSVYYEDL